MAATDLDDLNNFEYHFETAAATFLNTDTGIDVFRTVIEDSLIAPRLDIQMFVDAAMEPFAPRNGGASSSTEDYRAYSGVFQCRVVTDNATGGAANHATYRAQVRTSLMRSAANWGTVNLEYYDIKKLMAAGTEYEVDGDMNITQLMYELTFEIRDDAWPV